MKNLVGLRSASTLLIAFVLVLGSCKKDEESSFSSQDTQSINTDNTVESTQEEVTDIANAAIVQNDGGGRTSGSDDRTKGATIAVTGTKEAGTIVITFPSDGATDSKGNVRKGKITITWTNGRWLALGSSYTVTLSDYSINGVLISGSRTVTNISTTASPLTWTITGTYTSTWPDKTTATRTVNRTRQWIRAATSTSDDKIIISQTSTSVPVAQGINRYGKQYSVQITTPLEYSASCLASNKVFKPVKGIRIVTVGTGSESKAYTFDYGTGACDDSFTVSFNGKTKQFTAKNDSSND